MFLLRRGEVNGGEVLCGYYLHSGVYIIIKKHSNGNTINEIVHNLQGI